MNLGSGGRTLHRPAPGGQPTAPRPLRPRGPLLIAAGATGLLIVVDLAVRGYHAYVSPVPGLRAVFNVGAEGNLASWWNSALLLSVAGMALVLALLTGPGERPGRSAWLGPALVAAWLSFDESAQIHERLTGLGAAWSGAVGVSLPTFAWVLPGAVVACAGTVLAVVWAGRLPRDLRRGLLGALAVYLTGALVVESLNGWLGRRGADLLYALGTSLEEALEMSACLLALAALAQAVIIARDPATRRITARLR